jgi:hypothetical protein
MGKRKRINPEDAQIIWELDEHEEPRAAKDQCLRFEDKETSCDKIIKSHGQMIPLTDTHDTIIDNDRQH